LFKNTALNCTFNSLGSERYLLTEDNKSLRDIAANVPYDAISVYDTSSAGLSLSSHATNGLYRYVIIPDSATPNNKLYFGYKNHADNWYAGSPAMEISYTGNVSVNNHLYVDSPTLVVDSTNHRVGIGTSSPDTNFQVANGVISVGKDDTTYGRAYLYGAGSGNNGGLLRLYTSADFDDDNDYYRLYVNQDKLFLASDSANFMTFDKDGNVGIGITNPVFKLHVAGTGNTAVYQTFTTGNTGHTNDDGFTIGVDISQNAQLINQENTDMIFSTNDAEKMRLDSSGNLGIGTASPAGALDVSSTTGGFIVPRMTAAQVAALAPVNGMIVYDTTNNKFQFYENGAWVSGSGLA